MICASVNDAVSHGIPDDYRLRDGDASPPPPSAIAGDISHAISTVARKADCGMPADFGGHGIR